MRVSTIFSTCHVRKQLTLVANQLFNVIVPAKYYTEHVLTKIIGCAVGAQLGVAVRNVTESSFGEGKEVHVFGAVGFIGASQHFLAEMGGAIAR